MEIGGILMNEKNHFFKFENGVCYALDYEKLKELCLTSSDTDGASEFEISEAYEVNEQYELELSSKVVHETKTNKNPQNDMIMYDLVKLMLVSLLDNASKSGADLDLGSLVTLNTLLHWGVLKEI